MGDVKTWTGWYLWSSGSSSLDTTLSQVLPELSSSEAVLWLFENFEFSSGT